MKPKPRCLVIGAGALGGPLAMALHTHGVPLRIVDDDTVELSNLPRQIQFRDEDLGQRKVIALRQRLLTAGAPPDDVEIEAVRFDDRTARRLSEGIAVIIDASDSPATKFLANDWALAMGVPYVIAAAIAEQGNVFASGPGLACYRCLFETPPDDAASCASAGVLAPICGLVAARAAAAAVHALETDPARAASTLSQATLDSTPVWRTLHLQRRATCVCTRPRMPRTTLALARQP